MADSGSGVGVPIVPSGTGTLASVAVTSGCGGRYAEAWEYVIFWCRSQLLMGIHDGVGAADAALEDAEAMFKSNIVLIDCGMILYNLTAGTSG